MHYVHSEFSVVYAHFSKVYTFGLSEVDFSQVLLGHEYLADLSLHFLMADVLPLLGLSWLSGQDLSNATDKTYARTCAESILRPSVDRKKRNQQSRCMPAARFDHCFFPPRSHEHIQSARSARHRMLNSYKTELTLKYQSVPKSSEEMIYAHESEANTLANCASASNLGCAN